MIQKIKDMGIKEFLIRCAVPLIYMPFYFATFNYLENRPVTEFLITHVKLDDMIPFCEYFFIPYASWFFYIAATIVFFIFQDREEYIRICFTLGFGMTLFLIFSYFVPTMQPLRPTTFSRDNIFISLVKHLYATDTPTNVLPSIHVYNALMATIAFHKNKGIQAKPFLLHGTKILCILIILSTMFIKQHSVIDVIAGLLLGGIAYFVVYVLPIIKDAKREITDLKNV